MPTGRPQVLLVNCFRDEREMYVEYLQHVGLNPLHECDAHDALTTARSVKPDVVITDMVLTNGADGVSLIRQLRGDPETQRTSIIVVSGLVTPKHQQDALDAGATVFLMKPCLPEALAHEIRRCVAGRRRRDSQKSVSPFEIT